MCHALLRQPALPYELFVMGRRKQIKEGEKYGMLKVLCETHPYISRGKDVRMVLCECDCGKKVSVKMNKILSGKKNNCGCVKKNIQRKKAIKHDMCYTQIYSSWASMKYRCNNKNMKRYGGRGISYDHKWEKFENFYRDMFQSWKEHVSKYGKWNTTIERIDNNGNYCKENCKRATYQEQGKNKTYFRGIGVEPY